MNQNTRPARSRTQERTIIATDRFIYRVAHRWLLITNIIAFVLASIPFITPFLMSRGYHAAANILFTTFGLMCHQMPERTFMLFGEPMALCHRMSAIYVSAFLLGLLYAFVRNHIRPLSFLGLFLFSFPMAIDGFTQLFGLRESVWELRLITGTFFSTGVAWFVFPRLEEGFFEIRELIEKRFDRLVRRGRAHPL